jgi:hypothetical protein
MTRSGHLPQSRWGWRHPFCRRRTRDVDLSICQHKTPGLSSLPESFASPLKGLSLLSTHHLNPPVQYVSTFYTVSPPLQFVAKNPFAKGWITLLGGG